MTKPRGGPACSGNVGRLPRTFSRHAGLVSSPWLSESGLQGVRENQHPAMAFKSVVLRSGCGRDPLIAKEPGAEEPPTAQPAGEGLERPGRSRRSPTRDFARVGEELQGAGESEAAVVSHSGRHDLGTGLSHRGSPIRMNAAQ
jgi:hypothetical protein